MRSCDPDKQPSGHGRPDPMSSLILDLDGSLCVVCKGGQIIATEAGDCLVQARCRRCGNTSLHEVKE